MDICIWDHFWVSNLCYVLHTKCQIMLWNL